MVYDGIYDEVFNLSVSWSDIRTVALVGGMVVMGYAYILMLAVFGVSLKSGPFGSMRFGLLLALLCVGAVAWALNLFNFVLVPLGTVRAWNSVFAISLNSSSPLHIAMYDLVSLVKVAALFVTSSVLVERRINL
jgi:hypothetical protein